MALLRAVIDPSFYAEALRHPASRVLAYVVLLALIGLALTAAGSYGEVRELGRILSQVSAELPSFTLAEGQLWSDAEGPVVLAETRTIMVVMDTSADAAPKPSPAHRLAVWIGERELAANIDSNHYRIQYLDLGPITIDTGGVRSALHLYPLLLIVVLLVSSLTAILLKLGGTVVLSLAALPISSAFGTGLGYGGVWRVSAYATVAPTLLLGTLAAARVEIAVPHLVYWSVALAYVVMGLRRLPPATEEEAA